MSGTYGPAQLMDEVHEHLAGHALLAGELEVADLDLAPNLQPPSVIVGPPTMTPQTADGGPALHELTVYVVTSETERAYRELVELASLVIQVLDEPGGIRIVQWRPTTFPAGGVELPAYAIDIEVIS